MEIIVNYFKIVFWFVEVELEGKVIGYGLFLGLKKWVILGEGYMLVGDVGYFVDFLIGEGIGNVFYSGFIVVE